MKKIIYEDFETQIKVDEDGNTIFPPCKNGEEQEFDITKALNLMEIAIKTYQEKQYGGTLWLSI